MEGLCALGFAYKTQGGAYCLTQKGADMVRQIKGVSTLLPSKERSI